MSATFLFLPNHIMKQNLKIRIISLFTLSLLSGGALMAQPVVQSDPFLNDTISEKTEEVELFKPHVNLLLGSSFSSFGPSYSAFSTYVAPEISMPVSNKLSMSFGMGYSNMFFSTPSESGMQSNSMAYGNVFVSGTYQVNNNLVVRGTAYKTFMLNPVQDTKALNSQFFDFSNQGVRFDAEYKVNDQFRIGVSVEYREQSLPSFYQGNNNYGVGSPFQRSMFSPIY